MISDVEIIDNTAGTYPTLGARYGAVLDSREVPGTPAGRAISAVVALAMGDAARLQLVEVAASGAAERDRLRQLAGLAAPPPAPAENDIRRLYEDGQYGRWSAPSWTPRTRERPTSR